MTYQHTGSPRFEDRVPTADVDLDFDNLNLGSRPVSLRTNSTAYSSSPNKDYLLYKFKRTGAGWYGANRAQVPLAQEDLKKLAGKGGRSTREQLRQMGTERREEIQALIDELDALEPEGAHWEPVYLETTASKIRDNKTRRVSAFDLVIHRRNKSVDKGKAEPKRRQSSTGSRPTKIGLVPNRPKPQVHMAPSSPAQAPRPSREDVFGDTRFFSPEGHPIDRNGTVPFEKGGKHSDMPFERPIGSIAPHFREDKEKKEREEQAKQDKAILNGIDVDSILGRKSPIYDDEDDEVLVVGDDRHPRAGGSAEAARAAKAKLRRASSSRRHNVAYETREPLHHSNRSSWASSDQASVYFGELDERSSMTSDETRGSDRPAKYYRNSRSGVPHVSVSRSPSGRPRYHVEAPVYNTYERHHRRLSSHDSSRRPTPAFEQPVRIHHSPLSSSPIVHQRPRETFRDERIPPIVPEVRAYSRQARISEGDIPTYIQDDRRQEIEPPYSPHRTRPSLVEVGRRNRSSYNFEPRNQYR